MVRPNSLTPPCRSHSPPSSMFSPGRTSPKTSSPRRQAFAARELDPLLANLSPAATLEALKASNVVDSAAGSKHRLLTDSIADVSPSERALGIRAAIAAKKLREWCTELRSWKWPSRQFEPPALKQLQSDIQPSHNGSIDQALVIDQFVDDRYDMTYWGSLPAQTVQEHDDRLEEIQDSLEALELDGLKEYIRKAHLLTSKGSEASLNTLYSSDSSNGGGYNRLDDFTVIITATIMQALPYLSRLSSLIELWHTRLLVLHQVPIFLHQLEDAQTAMASAQTALSGASFELTRDSYQTMKDVLSSRVTVLAQTLDNMLDVLEGRPDNIPDHWIDDMENVERAYQSWVVEAEQVVMANELDELRSLKVDSPKSDRSTSRLGRTPPRKSIDSTNHGSQSEATAVGEEEIRDDLMDTPKRSKKDPPASIDISKVSGWAETEDIKREAARQASRRSSFSYSEMSDEPEVIQTSQVQYVNLSPSIASPGIKPSLVEISSRSSKRSSRHSAQSSEPTSPALTRNGSTSAQSGSEVLYEEDEHFEAGVSGPPAVFAPWPPTKSPNSRTGDPRQTMVRVYDAYYDSSDSEDEGGLRSYGSLSPAPRQGRVSAKDTAPPHGMTEIDSSKSNAAISVDDFFDSIIQPFSDPTPASRPTTSHSYVTRTKSIVSIPQRDASQSANKSRLAKASSRAVSPLNQDIETQLNSRISNLLSRIPAPIRFFGGPEDDVSDNASSPSPSTATARTARSPAETSALRLAPAHSATKSTTASSSRSAHSEVRLYHLHQPGRGQPIKLYVRLVGDNHERVMVRVGGGWSDLGEYLHEYASHHGRHATIDAGGADLELKDFPLPQSNMSRNTSSSFNSLHHHTGSGSPLVHSRNLATSSETPMIWQNHAGPSRRHFSIGSSKFESRVPLEGMGGTLSTSHSQDKIRMHKTRQSSRRNSIRLGAVTPPHQMYEDAPFALGPAGPAARPKDISPKKRAWVEGVMSQARKVSGGGTRMIRVDDYFTNDRSDSASTIRRARSSTAGSTRKSKGRSQ